ncbi:MAG: proton-conducting transporter membrane subunit [Euryarchaeota archaeon]|nr:proton-conducting transporter membrane subunit [Euryarchaeota archaeon]
MINPVLPLIFLLAGSVLAYAMGRAEYVYKKKYLAAITGLLFFGIALLLQILLAVQIWENGSTGFYIGDTLLRMDGLAVFLALIALTLGSVVCLYSVIYMKNDEGQEYYYTLLLLMVAGIVGIGLATDFLVLYLFFELMSIPSYALVVFRRHEMMAIEAGMKYIVMGAVGSAFAFFGISLVYFQTGTLSFSSLIGMLITTPLLQAALLFLIIGFGVKAAIVPLHTWLPDAHSAAPSGISAMLSGIVIGAGFFTLLRSILIFSGTSLAVGEMLIIIALITMSVGNLMAFSQLTHKQADLKRILAYSSVAQMGYIVLGVGVGLAYGIRIGYEGGLFHIMTHAFMKGLAFLCAGAIIHELGTRYLDEMDGIGLSMKTTGFAFTLSLLALAGVPPLSGFMSEWMVFSGGILTYGVIGWWGIAIAVIALLNALLSLGYYLPIIKTLYLPAEHKKIAKAKETSVVMLAAIGILAALTIILGIWPELGLQAVKPAVDILMSIGGV